MNIFRHSIQLFLVLSIAIAPMLSLVSTSASAADVPACHKNNQDKKNTNIEISGQAEPGTSGSSKHDNCNNQCGACFTCLKLPATLVRMDGPVTTISTYIHTPETTFNNISPRQEPHPPRLV